LYNKKNIFQHNELKCRTVVTASSAGESWKWWRLSRLQSHF